MFHKNTNSYLKHTFYCDGLVMKTYSNIFMAFSCIIKACIVWNPVNLVAWQTCGIIRQRKEGFFPPFKDVARRETDGPISSGRPILFAQCAVFSYKSKSYIHHPHPVYQPLFIQRQLHPFLLVFKKFFTINHEVAG